MPEIDCKLQNLPSEEHFSRECNCLCWLDPKFLRYITRPPIATKRLSVDGRGRVVYRYKHPFRDGSTHVVLEPLDFIARLATLVPRPRMNLARFHGV
ncbi:MAG: transposase, partial [Gammaproteobacteria bacterium]|nr:transposase [Gammaproteobacteria bacterium]